MPSSADGFDAAIARAERAVRDAWATAVPGDAPALTLIDGRSGSGKTTLAARLASGGDSVQVVALDDLYPGWDGLAEGAELARTLILEPYVAGRVARWRRWDWTRQAPGEKRETHPGLPLVVEGSGMLTAEAAALAPVRVWLESPESTRRERALARDGDTYRPHWARWAAQEVRHLADDDPLAHATIVVEVP